MKTPLITSIFAALILSLSSCSKDTDNNSSTSPSGTFVLTSSSGKTYTANYTTKALPVDNNTFAFYYADRPGDYKYQFIAFFDSRNETHIDLFLTNPLVPNTTYTKLSNLGVSPTGNDFFVDIEGKDIYAPRQQIVYEQFQFPGRIKGSAKGLNSDGSVLYTVTFDFTIK